MGHLSSALPLLKVVFSLGMQPPFKGDEKRERESRLVVLTWSIISPTVPNYLYVGHRYNSLIN